MIETIFTEKRIIKKIIIAIIFIFLFNFTFSYLGNNVVFAAKDENGEEMTDKEIMEEEGGGKLLIPIHALVLFLADSVLEIMQNSFISSDPVTITARADTEAGVSGWAIAGIAIGVVVFAIACVVTYGAAAAVVGAAAGATSFAAGAAAVAGTVATYQGVFVGGLIFAGASVAVVAFCADTLIDDIKGEFELPTIQYTPEVIFSNQVPLFNINFFNPASDKNEIKEMEIKLDVIDRLARSDSVEVVDYATYFGTELSLFKKHKIVKELKEKYGYDKERKIDNDSFYETIKTQKTTMPNGVELFYMGNYACRSDEIEAVWYNKEETKVYCLAVASTLTNEISGSISGGRRVWSRYALCFRRIICFCNGYKCGFRRNLER